MAEDKSRLEQIKEAGFEEDLEEPNGQAGTSQHARISRDYGKDMLFAEGRSSDESQHNVEVEQAGEPAGDFDEGAAAPAEDEDKEDR